MIQSTALLARRPLRSERFPALYVLESTPIQGCADRQHRITFSRSRSRGKGSSRHAQSSTQIDPDSVGRGDVWVHSTCGYSRRLAFSVTYFAISWNVQAS